MKGADNSARELIARLSNDLRGLLRLRSVGQSDWMHRRADGIREADRTIDRAAVEGSDRVAATQHANELAHGSAPPAPRAARTPLTDLSHMPPLGDLHDGVHRGEINDHDLTEVLGGLQRRYGPYQVEDLNAWHTPAFVEDGHTVPALVRFVADIRDSNGNDAGSLIYSFTRDNRGDLVVTNERTELHKDFTGKGFASAFSASTENYFRRSGVDRMELIATRLNENDPLDGAVAWAKAGYDWNPAPEKLAVSVSNMKSHIDSLIAAGPNRLTPGDTVLLQDMRARFDGSVADFPSPRELVMLAGDNPKLGEELMKGSTWHGMKKL